MDKELTEIIVVLDRSSSMRAVADETVHSFNNFVKEQKEAKTGRCLLTLTQFNTNYEIVYSGKPIEDVPPLDFRPSGMTALLDAVGRTINEVGQRLKDVPEEQRPGNVVMVILTDGEENSSRECHKGQIETMVKHQADRYDWTFVFLGQNIDAFRAGLSMGFSNEHKGMFVGNVSAGGAGVSDAYHAASRAVISTRRKVASGVSKDFMTQERAAYTSALAGDDSGLDELNNNSSDSGDTSTSESST